jgi:GDPmannose 4,6-dehydratase
MTKTALITGISGQDGAYLSRLLLEKGYRVLGSVRDSAPARLDRLRYLNIASQVELVKFDLLDVSSMACAIEKFQVDEIYNLAAQSVVAQSFQSPIETLEINAMGVAKLLEAVRMTRPDIHFYQASSSEMFGKATQTPQNEATPFHPRSPYAAAKVCAHCLTVNYREGHNLYCVSGILFNHDSPLRGRPFVTRKISLGFAEMKHGQRAVLALGNLDAARDLGYAEDYVEGMWRMLQRNSPDDFLLATGKSTTVRRFAELAGRYFGFGIDWVGSGSEETGIDRRSGLVRVKVDPQFYRPTDVDALVGRPEKANAELGWRHKVELPELVAMMCEADDRRVRDGSDPV